MPDASSGTSRHSVRRARARLGCAAPSSTQAQVRSVAAGSAAVPPQRSSESGRHLPGRPGDDSPRGSRGSTSLIPVGWAGCRQAVGLTCSPRRCCQKRRNSAAPAPWSVGLGRVRRLAALGPRVVSQSESPSGLLYNQGEGPVTQQAPPMVAMAMVRLPGEVDGEKSTGAHRGRVIDVELLGTGRSKAAIPGPSFAGVW